MEPRALYLKMIYKPEAFGEQVKHGSETMVVPMADDGGRASGKTSIIRSLIWHRAISGV